MTGSAGEESVKRGGNLSRADSQNPLHPQKPRVPRRLGCLSSLTRASGALRAPYFPELCPRLPPLCVEEAGRASSPACREEAVALIQTRTDTSLSVAGVAPPLQWGLCTKGSTCPGVPTPTGTFLFCRLMTQPQVNSRSPPPMHLFFFSVCLPWPPNSADVSGVCFPRGGQKQRLLPAGLAWAFGGSPAASSCAFAEPLQWCLNPGFASSRAVDLM